MSYDARSERFYVGLGLGFAVVALAAMSDLLIDWDEGTTWAHILTEGFIGSCGVAGVAALLGRLRSLRLDADRAHAEADAASARAREAEAVADLARARADGLANDLRATRAEADRWRAEAGTLLKGLGAAIDVQFERWELSGAEREVALLLLKGLSHKELAEVRDVGEATARQQARAVYRKANLSGRHELAAFFLEDLLLPSRSSAEGRA